jgi:hypothetical protein
MSRGGGGRGRENAGGVPRKGEGRVVPATVITVDVEGTEDEMLRVNNGRLGREGLSGIIGEGRAIVH